LFTDMSREDWRTEGFAFGEVTREAVYLLPSGKTRLRIPTPPNLKNHGNEGEPLSNFEPGTDIKAHATVLAEGCWGHLTGAAIKEFDLAAGREPQVWELGVKEVWKVPKPLDRVIHTIGPWPLKLSARYGQIGGTWLYPMKDETTGEDLVSIGFVVDL